MLDTVMNYDECLYKGVCTTKCSETCVRYVQMDKLLELSNLPKRLRKPTRLKCPPEYPDFKAYTELAEYKNNISANVKEGNNLLICSKYCGNGKTTWASKIMLKYFDETWFNSYGVTRGLFVHVPTLLNDIRCFENCPEYIERINEADLVIWDDIAYATSLTEFQSQQLLMYIDYRINECKSNIYTCNMITKEEMSNKLGLRLASRIYNQSKVVELIAKDYRG